MTSGWIAERLAMGTKGHLAYLLYWAGRKAPAQMKNMSIQRTDPFRTHAESGLERHDLEMSFSMTTSSQTCRLSFAPLGQVSQRVRDA